MAVASTKRSGHLKTALQSNGATYLKRPIRSRSDMLLSKTIYKFIFNLKKVNYKQPFLPTPASTTDCRCKQARGKTIIPREAKPFTQRPCETMPAIAAALQKTALPVKFSKTDGSDQIFKQPHYTQDISSSKLPCENLIKIFAVNIICLPLNGCLKHWLIAGPACQVFRGR